MGIEVTVEKGIKTTGYFFNMYVYCIHNTYNISNTKLQRKTYQDQIKKSFQFQVLQPFFIFHLLIIYLIKEKREQEDVESVQIAK